MFTAEQLPVRPKTHSYTTRRRKQLLLAVMPRPAYQGTEPCVGSESFTHERNSSGNHIHTDEVTVMRKQCQTCPVLVQCAEYAIAHEKYFFWGGMTAAEREGIRNYRGQALVDLLRFTDGPVS